MRAEEEDPLPLPVQEREGPAFPAPTLTFPQVAEAEEDPTMSPSESTGKED